MKRFSPYHLLMILLIAGVAVTGCDEIFGTKSDPVTDEIFEEGRQDPNLIVDEAGYAALLPFWDHFDRPTDVMVGFDELVYVTDASGLHILDRAGRPYRTIPFDGATRVVQDRLLNVYVSARIDTVANPSHPDVSWNLPAVFKLENPGSGNENVLDTLIMPFADDSYTAGARSRRLNPARDDNFDKVELTGLGVLHDNTIYVARRGPQNVTGQITTPDNTILIYGAVSDASGNPTGKMQNTGQIRALNPNNPSLLSGVGIGDMTTLVGAPQRENMTENLSFILTQADTTRNIPIRVLWIDATMTIDGLVYSPRSELMNMDTTRAESFLYQTNRFSQPSGVAYSADARGHIFVTDAAKDSLFLFQSNGQEGKVPEAGSERTKADNVSFGGRGSGPRQFRDPGGVAYFRRVVYVADTGNNRISRFKLNTDFE
ncbi:hypothetical protein QA596_03810 [Balneolales bacterium ANBcel1]|nr:hypothetical protein [Balneolales bacterium ANBcel1]